MLQLKTELLAPKVSDSARAQVAGIAAFAQQRKHNNRERLFNAAASRFCENGYLSVSVDEIAAAAGVARMTVYRHFSSKAALAIALFKHVSVDAMPRYLSIGHSDFRDRATVAQWISDLFTADRANRRLLWVFSQATASEPNFTRQAQQIISDLIAGLGEHIPAFAVDPQLSRRRWLEAWLLLYEILDQSNHAALDSGVATDPLVIELLTERFIAFIQSAK